MGTTARHGGLVGVQVYRRPCDVNLPTRPFRFPCHCVHVHYLTVLGDGPRVVRMARPGRSTAAPCPLWAPRRPFFNPVVSLCTIKPWTCNNCAAKIWHLPHNDPVTQWRSKPVHTMEIQAGSHNGDPSRFTQWRPGRFTQWRSEAGSRNGDPRRFTQWRSKLATRVSWESLPPYEAFVFFQAISLIEGVCFAE